MLKLKLQYFGHPMRRADSVDKTLMLGKTEGKRRYLNGLMVFPTFLNLSLNFAIRSS